MTTILILLVEDEPNSVFFFEHAATKVGITNPLRVAKDGREALDYLEGVGEFADRRKHPLPGLVILDLKLPRVAGFEVLKQLRQQPETRALPVLMLTSSASDEDVARAYALGANGYLVKPSQLEELVKVVQGIKDFWLTLNRPPPPGGAS
ncbi:MAG: two-component system response regulator [Verrucomicrobia bacterium]|nr:two-component system response regulator [Verrucomicrobiota bacterium]